MVVPTSQSSALQRSGRAGRIRSGRSYRLYTEEAFHKLRSSTVAEMQRSNMAPVILQLKALGVDNILRFNFLSVCATRVSRKLVDLSLLLPLLLCLLPPDSVDDNNNVLCCCWQPPPADALLQGLELLYALEGVYPSLCLVYLV